MTALYHISQYSHSGKRLAEKFLAEGAVSEVNVDSDDRKQISDSLERSEAPKELFDGAEKWVYQLMATGSFMKFRLSRPYKNFIESRSFVQRGALDNAACQKAKPPNNVL